MNIYKAIMLFDFNFLLSLAIGLQGVPHRILFNARSAVAGRFPNCFFLRMLLRGITLNNIFYVTGGTSDPGGSNQDQVYAWDSESETWNKVRNMREPRSKHAVTLIRHEDIDQYGMYCDD